MQDLGQLLSQGGSLVPSSASALPQLPGQGYVAPQPTTGQSWAGNAKGPMLPGQGTPPPAPQQAPPDPLQGMDPNDPEQVEANKTGWKKFFGDLRENPQMLAYLINFGAGLAATGQVHEAVQYGMAGVGRYQQELTKIQQQQIENARADRAEGRQDRQLDMEGQRVGMEGERIGLERERIKAAKEQAAAQLGISEKELDIKVRELGLKEAELDPSHPSYQLAMARIAEAKSGIGANQALAEARRAGIGETAARTRLLDAQTAATASPAGVDANLWKIATESAVEMVPDETTGLMTERVDMTKARRQYNALAERDPRIQPIYNAPSPMEMRRAIQDYRAGKLDPETMERMKEEFGPEFEAKIIRAAGKPPAGERDVLDSGSSQK